MSEINGKRSGPRAVDIAESIARENTPEKCIGCYHPYLIGVALGRKVLADEISMEEAASEFKDSMSKCNFGRIEVRRADNTLAIDCSLGQLCGNFVQTAEPVEEHFWETPQIY